ncbi:MULTISPECIES: helix-turn-helix transcriptional regulator [unclassified Chitinophaga]|uniref:helix-turn-helix transcriptional regulator n=1 Tax=unclassified Chitinophaga TaxID=2619133 RepID=UPI0008AD6C4A|nr:MULTISPECIES: helix-turn-helix transcriptional regulator [unclassified Chitinophaga]WPV65418.1 helix-turn-helix transcriptional regulator [Chitinophaga sp. LS1]SEW46012.1 DNA-binding transcriptional regulator, XRE-family HTH domain [Chitinophaga sp. YR573]
MTTTSMPEKVHQGRAVKRLREILHIKQDVLADALNISQQSISLLETKETIEPEQLEQIAKTLKVPVDAIKNFNEDAAINNIACNFNDNAAINYKPVFNPIDRWVEAMEENKRLYEALLKSEREKIALLEKMLAEKKK